MNSYKIALCQITPSDNKDETVQRAFSMIEKAASAGALLIALPEMFYCPLDLSRIRKISGNESEILESFRELAKKNNIYLCTGSMAYPDNGLLFNRAFLIGPNGNLLLSYDKIHLYDVSFRNFQIRESSVYTAGSQLHAIDTDLGKIGVVICYDIRFPELFRQKAFLGADVVLVPSVFNSISGPAHWHVLMRTRAIENQFFLAAISQGRITDSYYKAYGHSMIVSPWGDILAEADESEQIVYSEIDLQLIAETRCKLPLLKHRRTDLY